MGIQAVLSGAVLFFIGGVLLLKGNGIGPHKQEGVRVQVHSGLAMRGGTRAGSLASLSGVSGAGVTLASRPAVSPGQLGACAGPAVGSPNIKPSKHKYIRTNVETTTSDPKSYVAPKSRRCRDINAPAAIPATSSTDEGIEGMDALVKFGKANRLLPTCDISKLRSWGGFPMPSDYCKAGPGTHFGNGASGAVSFTSYEMRSEMQAQLKEKKLARIAWVPSLRKCGSTVVDKFFVHTKATSAHLADDPRKHPDVWTDEQIASKFFQFTVVRDPLSHFLAGAHQVTVFHRMGWLGAMVKHWGVEFQDRTCLNTTWGKIEPCAPPYANAVELLEVILDDIERLGFFDEHIFPMTFPIAVSKGLLNPANYYMFDISNITALEDAMNSVVYDESEADSRYKTGDHFMSRDGIEVPPWIIKAGELLELAEHDCKARSVVQRFCKLYAEDYACLPYTLPRICQTTV